MKEEKKGKKRKGQVTKVPVIVCQKAFLTLVIAGWQIEFIGMPGKVALAKGNCVLSM